MNKVDPTLSSFTSQTLLGKVRDLSDRQAWDEFVRQYTPRIFSWCKSFSLQDQDASDVTQQVLMKLVSAMQAFDYDPARGSFRGWLKTVTSNAVKDMVRKQSSKVMTGQMSESVLNQLADESAIESLAASIEEGYRRELLSEAESRVQLRVKPATWSAYSLVTHELFDAHDAASKLGIKIADVYVAKSRVIKMLKETVSQLEKLT